MDKFYSLIIESGTWKAILAGLWATVKISVLSLILGSFLGLFVCYLRMHKNKVIRTFASIYIAVIRGVPVLMLLMMMYYVVFAKTKMEAEFVAVITFALNVSAYIAELVRSAINATDKGQVEAARTLGFSKIEALRYVTFPQAAEIAKPVYESTIVNLIQWTSVVGYVTITDLTRVINTASARTMQPVFMIMIGMIIYLAMAYIVKGIFTLSDLLKAKKVSS